jgi:hypothetical protein
LHLPFSGFKIVVKEHPRTQNSFNFSALFGHNSCRGPKIFVPKSARFELSGKTKTGKRRGAIDKQYL